MVSAWEWRHDDDSRSRNPSAQMMSPEEITNVLDLVTTNGAVTMNITDHYGIEENKPANFIVLDAKSEFEAICERAGITASVRHGEFLFKKFLQR